MSDWPKRGGTIQDMHRPITEEWLIASGFRIDEGRNDPRMPIRSLSIGGHVVGAPVPFQASDDLCIDVSPVSSLPGEWFVWIAQRDPYRHIHVRHMRETWELVRLYEGLTGRVWPGTL